MNQSQLHVISLLCYRLKKQKQNSETWSLVIIPFFHQSVDANKHKTGDNQGTLRF